MEAGLFGPIGRSVLQIWQQVVGPLAQPMKSSPRVKIKSMPITGPRGRNRDLQP